MNTDNLSYEDKIKKMEIMEMEVEMYDLVSDMAKLENDYNNCKIDKTTKQTYHEGKAEKKTIKNNLIETKRRYKICKDILEKKVTVTMKVFNKINKEVE